MRNKGLCLAIGGLLALVACAGPAPIILAPARPATGAAPTARPAPAPRPRSLPTPPRSTPVPGAITAVPVPGAALPESNKTWAEASPSPGTWVYRADAQWPVALFGEPGRAASFALRCDRARGQMLLQRAVPPGTAPGAMMSILTSAAQRAYPTLSLGWAPAYLTAELPARDPQLDAMAFSRGKFVIALEGQPRLILPSWVEVTRMIEDCRS
ncbi:MAG: hypothetical protein ACKOXK_03875 [Chakrabartia sp.]